MGWSATQHTPIRVGGKGMVTDGRAEREMLTRMESVPATLRGLRTGPPRC